LEKTLSELPASAPRITVVHKDLRDLLRDRVNTNGIENIKGGEVTPLKRGPDPFLESDSKVENHDANSLDMVGDKVDVSSEDTDKDKNKFVDLKITNGVDDYEVNGNDENNGSLLTPRAANGEGFDTVDLRHRCDLITANPPYAPLQSGTLCKDAQRRSARFELRGGVEVTLTLTLTLDLP
jgi:hypothetical protein